MRSFKIFLTLGLVILLISFSFNCKALKNPHETDIYDISSSCSNYPAMGQVGDEISSCYFKIKLKSVVAQETICDGQYTTRDNLGKYIIVDVEITNIGTEQRVGADNVMSILICHGLFKIKDDKGNTYDTSSPDYAQQIIECLPGSFKNEDCSIYFLNQGTSGKIVFVVPKDATSLILVFYSGETENTIEFDLGL